MQLNVYKNLPQLFFYATFEHHYSICWFCSEIKERVKKTKDEKKAKKAETVAKTQKTQTKGVPKAATKGPKLGGGGGKR